MSSTTSLNLLCMASQPGLIWPPGALFLGKIVPNKSEQPPVYHLCRMCLLELRDTPHAMFLSPLCTVLCKRPRMRVSFLGLLMPPSVPEQGQLRGVPLTGQLLFKPLQDGLEDGGMVMTTGSNLRLPLEQCRCFSTSSNLRLVYSVLQA